MRKLLVFIPFFFLPSLVLYGGGEANLRKKADRIHRKMITLDSHNDTPLRMAQPGFDFSVRHDPRSDRSKVDLPRMAEGGLDGAFFAVFVSQGKCDSLGYARAGARARLLFDTLEQVQRRNANLIAMAYSPKCARRLKTEGRRMMFIGMENGYPIGLDTAMIRYFYQRGARYITLCHTLNNDICTSSTDSTGGRGLSDFGRLVVGKMNALGMMVDISHASDEAVWDILKISEAPVLASHSCAKALCDNPRNLSDTLLKALAANGGVVQMCILSDYVKKPPPNPARDSARAAIRKKFNNFDNLPEEIMKQARKEWYAIDQIYPPQLATVNDVADHIDHLVAVAGIDHVGIGTDFDGGGGVEGCYDVSEMKNITVELLRRGYSESQLRKIWGGNLMRVMQDNATIASELRSLK